MNLLIKETLRRFKNRFLVPMVLLIILAIILFLYEVTIGGYVTLGLTFVAAIVVLIDSYDTEKEYTHPV